MLLLNNTGETQTKARTSWKSECLLRQRAKHNKSAIWTQSKECASKDNAKIWKAYELQSEDKQGVDVLWLVLYKWRAHKRVQLVVQRIDDAKDWRNHCPPTKPKMPGRTPFWKGRECLSYLSGIKKACLAPLTAVFSLNRSQCELLHFLLVYWTKNDETRYCVVLELVPLCG